MTYSLTEIFYTLQGEGLHAGTPALFVRLAGCSQWSGRAEHRERDAIRSSSACPRFCDTDFIVRRRVSLAELLAQAKAMAPASVPLVVITGGEPLLQLDQAMVDGLRTCFQSARIALETNGNLALAVNVDWVCVSPKVTADRLQLRQGDEIKIVVPAYDPQDYADIADAFTHRWVSAEAQPTGIGESIIVADRLQAAAAWVMSNPSWRLTLQAHKMIGVR